MIDHHRHYPAETAAEGHLRRFLHRHAPDLAATHEQRTADEQRAREATAPIGNCNVKSCECGCGLPAPIAQSTCRAKGHAKGEPVRFINGHSGGRGARSLWENIIHLDESPDGCWIWTGKQDGGGYGRLPRDGGLVGAHRAFYEAFVAPIPDGLQLDHLCRVPSCVNPLHLEPVTQTENVRRGANTKLTVDDVIRLRADFAESDLSLYAFSSARSQELGVHRSTITLALEGRTWRDVPTSSVQKIAPATRTRPGADHEE